MKIKNIAIICLGLAMAFASSCTKEFAAWTPKQRNVGTETLSVKQDTTFLKTGDTLVMASRGGSINLAICASYDGKMTASDWISLTSCEFPGDSSTYVLTVSAKAFSDTTATGPRTGFVKISTPTLSCELIVTQGIYIRPESPATITTAEEFVYWLGTCAVTFESDETMTLSADIDMSDVTEWTPCEKFIATLDGQGHKISGWKNINAPLFTVNEGVIKDLTIASSCNFIVPGETDRFGAFVGTNRGTISGCENDAPISLSAERSIKNYIGGMAGYLEAEGTISDCTNQGAISYTSPASVQNVYIGGMTGYSYGKITLCDNYGPITCTPEAFSNQYYIGGITPRHQTGDLTYNVNHKDGKIYINEAVGTSKSYVGGIAGYLAGAPATTGNETYADIEVYLKYETYIGGLQGWQDKVTGTAEFNCWENSVVNCNITAYTKGTSKNGDNPCLSAGLVTGRFSGQKGSGTTLHYGNESNPIKVSGSVTCTATGTSKIAAKKDFQTLLCGDGSASSVNGGAVPEADFNTIAYEVRGDGQTGDPEVIDIKLDGYTLGLPYDGGTTSFGVKTNYDATVTITEGDWFTIDTETITGDGDVHDITVTAQANDHTIDRTGNILIKMEMGTTQEVKIFQAGNKTLPESLVVDPLSIEADPAGTEESKFDVTLNYDATLTASDTWIKLGQETIVGDEAKHTVKVTFEKNQTGAARQGTITVTLPLGMSQTISVNQEKFVYVPKEEIGTVDDFLDLMTYGGDPETYPATFTVKLTKDIDLNGKTFNSVNEFLATLDGQGHSLKNWASTAPLFTTLKGTVSNLKIDATCSTSASVSIAYIANNNNGTIENCTNNAAVKVTTAAITGTRITSFAAYNFGTIKGCTNNGAITYEPDSAPNQAIYLAGITCTLNGGTVENCTNNAKVAFAPVAVTAKAYQRVGGIASICVKNNYAIIKGCVNTQNAPISIIDPSGLITNAYAGNIVGEIETKGVSVLENCSAFGDVTTNVKNDNAQIGGIAGKIGKYSVTITLMNGCSVNCNITGAYKTTKTPEYNFLNSCGMIAGRLGGDTASAPLTLGAADNPVKVSGTINITASEGVEAQSVTISADNFGSYAVGNGSSVSTTTGSEGQIINAKYEVVTKQ